MWPKATPHLRSGTAAGRTQPESEARGGGREEQPYIQGVMAVRAQEGLEEPSYVEGQEVWREEIPSSKVRSSGCALLEQR